MKEMLIWYFLRHVNSNEHQERNEKALPSKCIGNQLLSQKSKDGRITETKINLCFVLFTPRPWNPYVSQMDGSMFSFFLFPECLYIGCHFKSYTFFFQLCLPSPAFEYTSEEWFLSYTQHLGSNIQWTDLYMHCHIPSNKYLFTA